RDPPHPPRPVAGRHAVARILRGATPRDPLHLVLFVFCSGEPVNPHDELQSLIEMFPDAEPLLADAEHVASQTLPEPYHRMLAHNHHMTVTMESYHGCPVDVRILDRRLEVDFYNRKIVLLKHGSDHVVQFGLVRFDLSYVTQAVRDEIIAGQ